MLTHKALLTKWSLYFLAFLAFAALQQLVLDGVQILGVVPFLMPMIVAVVAALEGSIPGTVFGIAVGFLCDLSGSGVFSGVYTLSFFFIALVVSVISKYWVSRTTPGSLIYALLSFAVLDLVQFCFLVLAKGAAPSVILLLAAKETALSILFVIPIFIVYSRLNRLFRYE